MAEKLLLRSKEIFTGNISKNVLQNSKIVEYSKMK
jgi:hypothetical protein